MRRIVVGTVLLVVGFVAGRLWRQAPVSAEGKEPGTGAGLPQDNGDLNGDGARDISDVVYLANWLFLGGPAPKPIEAPPCDSCCPPPGGGALPDTGQTTCYDAEGNEISCDNETCPGQDGLYATGCPTPNRFIDNEDGTVTDTCTGLMWQQDTADTNGDQQRDGNDEVQWCEALAYCESLELAGHDDWRLPNVRELQSILDYGRFDPAIDPVFGALSSYYWGSTICVDSPGNASYIDFFDGDVLCWNKGGRNLVRAVRTAP